MRARTHAHISMLYTLFCTSCFFHSPYLWDPALPVYRVFPHCLIAFTEWCIYLVTCLSCLLSPVYTCHTIYLTCLRLENIQVFPSSRYRSGAAGNNIGPHRWLNFTSHPLALSHTTSGSASPLASQASTAIPPVATACLLEASSKHLLGLPLHRACARPTNPSPTLLELTVQKERRTRDQWLKNKVLMLG